VAVSPDGQYVYTAAGSNENFTGSDAVAVFAWDGAMGNLSFVDAYFEGDTQGANTIDGLDRVSSVTVSPDGNHVYATGGVDPLGDLDWIAVFSRSAATGALTWASSIDHTTLCDLDITFGFETYAVVSPAGDRVFVTSPASAVVEFARNSTSGALTFADAECFFDALGRGVDQGTNLPRKLALDPTGEHLYVPGNASNAVAAFDTGGIFADGFESGDTSVWSSAVP
jgi:6-phosphogluconolactonase (cycloisomerase 2 family)